MMFTGEANFKTDVGGPITIIKMSSKAAKAGIWNLFSLIAILSVQIGIFNLIPFPALDEAYFYFINRNYYKKKNTFKICWVCKYGWVYAFNGTYAYCSTEGHNISGKHIRGD